MHNSLLILLWLEILEILMSDKFTSSVCQAFDIDVVIIAFIGKEQAEVTDSFRARADLEAVELVEKFIDLYHRLSFLVLTKALFRFNYIIEEGY